MPSLRVVLASAFGLIAVLAAGPAALLAGREASVRLQAATVADLGTLAQQLADRLDQGMFERWRDVQIAASLDTMRDPDATPAARQAVLERMHNRFADYATVGFIDPQGRTELDSRPSLQGRDASQAVFFRYGRDRPYVTEAHDAAPPGRPASPVVDFSAPVRQPDGRLVGVVAAELDWSWVARVEQQFAAATGRARMADALLVARDGRVLLGPAALLGRAVPKAASTGIGEPARWPDGRSYIVGVAAARGYQDYPGLGWTVLVRQDAATALAAIAELRHRSLLWGLIAATSAALLGSVLAGAIARPQAALAEAAARAECCGDAVPFPDGSGFAWYWEARTLAVSLAGLVARLRRLNETLEQRVAVRTAQLDQAHRALEAAQRLEALGRLTGGVAHDFNNLLQIMSSGLGLLERRRDPEQRRPIEQSMRQAAERGGKLTQQLLAFAGRQPLAPQAVSLAQRLESIRTLIEQSLRGDIILRISLPAGLWRVQADATQLDVALLNLAVNARDAMPGGGTLTIHAANERLPPREEPVGDEPAGDEPVGEFVRLSVSDTGTGMPPEVLARACEPFFTTKKPGKGTGLGLSQVHGFAHQSGGTMRLASTPGGTTVSLLLPRALLAAEEESAEAPALPGTTQQRRLSVLLAEDNDDLAELVVDQLGQLGHRVRRVASAVAALDLLNRSAGFDLLISDVVMPGGMSGLELAREVRGRLPVVLTTGYSDTMSEVLTTGLPVLRKPYRFAELERVLGAVAAGAPSGVIDFKRSVGASEVAENAGASWPEKAHEPLGLGDDRLGDG